MFGVESRELLAGMRFIDTAKYHGSTLPLLLLPCSNCFDISNDSNFPNSLPTVKNRNDVTLIVT